MCGRLLILDTSKKERDLPTKTMTHSFSNYILLPEHERGLIDAPCNLTIAQLVKALIFIRISHHNDSCIRSVSFMKNLLKISYIFVLLGEIQYTFIMSQVFKDYLEISVSRDYFKTLPKNKLLSKLFSILVITHTRETSQRSRALVKR